MLPGLKSENQDLPGKFAVVSIRSTGHCLMNFPCAVGLWDSPTEDVMRVIATALHCCRYAALPGYKDKMRGGTETPLKNRLQTVGRWRHY